jgi:hypothetical protein
MEELKEIKEEVERLKNLSTSFEEKEARRREKAINLLTELEKELPTICRELFHEHDSNSDYGAIKIRWYLYFRYEKYQGETPGFYVRGDNELLPNVGGTPLIYERGRAFWKSVDAIIDWLPDIIFSVEEENSTRDNLVEELIDLVEK